MSQFTICDICGERGIEEFYTANLTLYHPSGGCNISIVDSQRYDVCKKCSDEVKEFFKRGVLRAKK